MPTKFVSFPKYEYFIADQKYANIARQLGWKATTTEEGVNSLIKAVLQLNENLNEPKSLKEAGELLGKQNIIYLYALEGINKGMNTDIETAFSDDYVFEAFVAEAIIQNLKAGYYVDISDVKRNFKYNHFSEIVIDYAEKYNIK